jgi:polysaccharide export outer membrane protein
MGKGSIYAVALAAGLLSACSTVQDELVQPDPVPADLSAVEYYIGIGDTVQVSVWRNEELSITVPVRPDGKISTPLVGDVIAAGKTAEILAQELKEKLGSYVRNPEVTVIIAQANSAEFLNRVRVTGAVRSPMSVPYRDGMTVMDMVLMAGGLTEFAAANRAKLYRKTAEGTKVYPVYLREILQQGKIRSNYKLAPSDIVTIPERAF